MYVYIYTVESQNILYCLLFSHSSCPAHKYLALIITSWISAFDRVNQLSDWRKLHPPSLVLTSSSAWANLGKASSSSLNLNLYTCHNFRNRNLCGSAFLLGVDEALISSTLISQLSPFLSSHWFIRKFVHNEAFCCGWFSYINQ